MILGGGVFSRGVGGSGNLFGGVLGGSGGSIMNLPLGFDGRGCRWPEVTSSVIWGW